MSATDQMRAMLDQLMGTARNGKLKFFVWIFLFSCLLKKKKDKAKSEMLPFEICDSIFKGTAFSLPITIIIVTPTLNN